MVTIPVDGAASLRSALKTAKAGTTLELDGGNYGSLALNVPHGDPWARFDGEVTIRSADPNDPATFSSIFMRGVENLTIDGIVLDYTIPPTLTGAAIDYTPAALVASSANVTIRNSVFDGDVHDNPGSAIDGLPGAQGLFVRESKGITVEDNEFVGWRGAANFQYSSDVVVSGNDMHTLRSEGMNLTAVQDVLIERNHFHDFVANDVLGDHRDMIQFWTAGTNMPSTDVVIRENFFDSGSGLWTQSILMTVDPGADGPGMHYRNIDINNNVMYNAHYHGITVEEANGLKITNNTLLYNSDSSGESSISPPHINVSPAASNVQITNNIAAGVAKPSGSSVGWTVSDNLIVQHGAPEKPNWYGDLFINALTGGGEADLAALQALPGGVVEKGGYGSSLTRFDRTPDALTAIIRPENDANDDFSFDGGYTANLQGTVGSGATFQWDLGDGTRRQGVEVDHSYAKPGTYQVKLTVTDPGGKTDTALAEAYVPEPVRLLLDATAGGLADVSTYAASSPPSAQIVQDGGRYAARLTDRTGFGIDRGTPVYDLDAFTISFDFRAASGAASNGDIFRIHNSMDLGVGTDGSFGFGFINDAGQRFQLRSAPTKALDGAWHTVTLSYDKADGQIELQLDGVRAGNVAASGSTKPMESWGLHFGSIWGRTGFDGLIDDFEVRDEDLGRAGPDDPVQSPEPPVDLPDEQEPPAPPPTGQQPPPAPPPAGGTDVTRIDFEAGEPIPDARLFRDAAVSADGTLELGAGGGYLALGHEGQPPATGAVSVAFDIRFDEMPQLSNNVMLLSKHGQYAVQLRDGNLQAAVRTDGGGIVWTGAVDATEMLDNDWHRIALSIDPDADVLRFYVDGDLAVERTGLDLELSDSSRALTFGSAGWGDYVTGEIDDIVVAGAALDAEALM